MRRKKFFKFLSVVLGTTLLFSGCNAAEDSEPVDDKPDPTPPSIEQTTASLNKRELVLLKGETATLTVNDYTGDIVWLSSNDNIATVNGGVVTGVAEGTAYITAKIGDDELACRVMVSEQATAVPTLVLDKSSTSVGKGFTLVVTPYVQLGMEFTEITDAVSITWTSSTPEVATVSNGVITGVAEGSATITAKYEKDGETLTASLTVSVVAVNYYKAFVGETEITANTPVNVLVDDAYLGTTGASTSTVTVKGFDVLSGASTDVTSEVTWQSTDPTVATANGNTVTGKTKNATAQIIASIDGQEVARLDVAGWSKITTKAQMDGLALVTWKERANEETVKTVLDGRYILGADIDYAGEYILPIANTQLDFTLIGNSWNESHISYCSWVWEDILKPITPAADWSALKFNTADSEFVGSNPLNLPFTGTFDGNGYSISNAQILDVNYLFANRASNIANGFNKMYASGGCFIGTNEGTVRNIYFDTLRYRKYYGEATEREADMTGEKYQIYCNRVSKKIPYNNTIEVTADSALIRENYGTLSDVQISSYLMGQYGVYSVHDSRTTEFAAGVKYNGETGVVNNLVVRLLSGDIPYLVVAGDAKNWRGGLTLNTNVLYAYNAGTFSNCLTMSDVTSAVMGTNETVFRPDGSRRGYCTPDKYMHTGDDDVCTACNSGTVENCKEILNGDFNAPASCMDEFETSGVVLDSYASAIWNTTTMSLKKGCSETIFY